MLSIDIGVKHLAHCYMKGLAICHWDVTDLTRRSCVLCGLSATKIVKGLSYCDKHNTAKGKCINTTMTDMAVSLKSTYDKFETPMVVIVENQIGPLASKMKGVQGLVVQYWVCRGCEVHSVSASNKLKLFNLGKTSYAQRKKASVLLTRQMLEKHAMPKEHFMSHTKKDDLSDAFLQLIWYATHTKVSEFDGFVFA
jgi:hypothetical protein